jgi:LacI family transcriptional regulator
MTSIKDIAKLAGMSPSTVSRVLNNRTYVKPAIREKILALVQQMGYVPNHAARSMVLNRSFTVGVIVPDTFNMFQRELFSTIEHDVEELGLHTHFFFVKSEADSELQCVRRLKSEKLDGIIVMMELGEAAFFEYLENLGIPVVLFGTFLQPNLPFSSFLIDEEEAGFDATQYLLGLGHTRIGIVYGGGTNFGKLRLAGFRKALLKAGIEWDEGAVENVPNFTSEAGRDAALALFERRLDLTALFAVTDDLAIGAMRGLFERGLKVPADVSVIGFDDLDISRYLAPGLTTIHQPVTEIGKKIVKVLQQLISGEADGNNRFIFSHRLVERESCRRL